jgi:REP element-mobilizing transposase RayT
MPRKPRLFLPGATYHVYCRVARGEFVFEDDFEAIEFVETLRKVKGLDGWTVFAWCLMGNHYHLVLKTRNVDLWRSMARLQGTVARNYNGRHRYLGRLWQSRYRARVIDSDEYFRQVVCYAHLNPVAAGIVDDPADFRYSGHRELIGLCKPLVIDRRATLDGFCPSGEEDLIEPYLEWIRSVAEAKWATTDIKDLPWWNRPKDIDEIADAELHSRATPFDGTSLAENRVEMDLDDFALRFEEAADLTVRELATRSRSKNRTQGRVEFATLAISRYKYRVCEVADLIHKHRSSVTLWLNKGLLKENTDPEFARRLDQIDEQISRRR